MSITYEEKDDTLDAASYLKSLIEHRWLIGFIAVFVTLLGFAYTLIAKPVYQANMLVQVDENVIQSRSILTDINGVFEKKVGVSTEMEVLRSRNVLDGVINNTHSYIVVEPKYFPVVGAWIARLHPYLSMSGLHGMQSLESYVWADEQALVSRLDVPDDFVGKEFLLTFLGDGKYRLRERRHDIDITGRVGELLQVPYSKETIEVMVDRIIAKPGTEFSLKRIPQIDAIERLQDSLKISEKGKQSGIINVVLEGSDPRRTSRIVNEIGQEYIRQSVDHKADEAEKSLVFLNKQLPELKRELENSEAKYNQIRNSYGTVDLGEEAKMIVQQAASNQTRLVELRQKRQELLSRFADEHPAVKTINQQIRDISVELNLINGKIKRMPAIEQEVLRVSRDVKVNTELYTNLLSTAQQLRQVSASRLGGARLLDMAAVPTKPVKPNKPTVLSVSALLGIALGVAAAFIRKRMSGEMPDPYTVENRLGLAVSATIPHSQDQERMYAQIHKKAKKVSLLPYDAPSDSAVESLRSFRTLLQSAISDSQNNIILITGPTPEVGKSFVSANFAAVLASIDKRVLLIDGDMRTGYLHRYFGLERENGLSEILGGTIKVEQAIHQQVVENVDFISTGELSTRPAELLAHKNFEALLENLSPRYDFILIDTAPALAFADAMIVATHASTIYNVVRDGISTVDEIEETVRRLTKAGGTVTGTVFNDLKGKTASRYGYGYGVKYGRYRDAR
ncbi:tyrosine-protein kinase Etk/Wzc [Noviherbaspirillum humi]|uniref:Putative tyrosine-protein kinase EpsB n=1 Tax=Noviherbaspirillum humi TaxID=1688639 RepID=A0A239GA24_9BURK|nr:polysaccharide biosynthesis tyrosine autokinase [Noviherbaspirillum humi]SNS65951.1 tyrosine-protein kinase Etk/Wzc [Noviherbaspirillum humi]